MADTIEEIIRAFEYGIRAAELACNSQRVMMETRDVRNAIPLLKTQEPEPPKHIHKEYPEHDWERNKDGSIDEFAVASDFHNGPRCKRCYDSFCVHCEPDGYETHKPCIVDEDRCPKCGNELFPPWDKARKITYCMDCGQAVKWK